MDKRKTRRSLSLVGLIAMTLLSGCAGDDQQPIDVSWIDYPETTRGDVIDVHHGVEVPDPYRWLEDEASEEAQVWLADQDAIAERFFENLPERQEALAYLDDHWLDGVVMVPVRKGDNSFFFKAVQGQPHNVLYVRKGDAEPEAIFDLNDDDSDASRSTRTAISVSPQGRYAGYPIHHDGADAAEIRFFDTQAGRDLDEFLPAAYVFVNDWLPDETGFYYTWVDMPTLMGQPTDKQPGVYLHRMGTPVAKDELVYARPWEGQYMASAIVADDGEHLLLLDMNIMGSRGAWAVRPLEGGADTPVNWLTEQGYDHRFAYVGSSASELFVITDYQSPNWRIVALDITNPGVQHLREVVPEADEPISMEAGTNVGHVVLHDGRLYVTYIQHNSHVIRIFDLHGEAQGEIVLPFLGSVASITATEDDPVLLIGLQSFLQPRGVYAYNTADGSLTPVETVKTPADFEDYDVERVFYESHDGKQIPMTVIRRAGTPRDGKDKVMLYGYGGWGLSLLPGFRNRVHTWLHLGGTYVLANLRGGGEYGDSWHQAGQFFNKQDVFKDFYAAAEYLVEENYTTPSRIAILGLSNGGLLTAAAYNQRPELFGAVVSEIAAVDMLRIQDLPIGATVTMELGNPNQSKEMFEYLLSYSPLHNVRHEPPFPPILNMVGENDPRCKPGHIYKFVAEMQRMGDPERVALLRVVRGAGHGSQRKDTQIEWLADEVAFAWAMTE